MPDAAPAELLTSCIIIPARFDSTRFPGKPLARLRGADGADRSLIEWTWRAAGFVKGVDQIVVATDDLRIAHEVERFGGVAVMTPAGCANGTERCAAALESLTTQPDIVVNFQGDAPLTPPYIVSAVIERMKGERTLLVATPAVRCTKSTLRHLIADRDAGRVGGTTVVFDRQHRALYFSKNILPYTTVGTTILNSVYLHLGLYAYRPSALEEYVAAPPSGPELAEGLEQLRFLDMGVGVGAVVCEQPPGLMIELNNPSDAPLIESELLRRQPWQVL